MNINRGFIFIFFRFFSIFSFLILLSLIFHNSSFAQVPQPQASSPQYNLNTNPDVPQNLNTYTQSVFIEILSTASCFLTGTNPLNPSTRCLGVDITTGKLGYSDEKPGGLLVVMGNMIGQTYSIPVSSVDYGKYLASNFGITRTARAQSPQEICAGLPDPQQARCEGDLAATPQEICADLPSAQAISDCISDITAARSSSGNSVGGGLGTGIGFVGLTPVLNLWKDFRNLAYLIFVFVFVLLGLGIMFRVNIDARTVMSIQNQIPKIVIGLILITFSYAIAGFLIDMMYVLIYLIVNLLYPTLDINTNPLGMVGAFGLNNIAWEPARSVSSVIASLFDGPLTVIISTIVGGVLGAIVGSSIPFIGTLIGGVGGAVTGGLLGNEIIGFVAGIIAYLIIIVAILNALFRTWFMLIKAYVYILLSVIFAPFWIMIGILPLGTGGVGPWLRSLIANLAAFPVVITIFLIGKKIIDTLKSSSPDANFTPPLIGNLGDSSTAALGSLIGLGLVLILPEALNITKSTLKAPDFKLTSAAGRAISIGGSVIGKPIGGLKSELFGKTALGEEKWATRKLGDRWGRFAAGFSGGRWEDHTEDRQGRVLSNRSWRPWRNRPSTIPTQAPNATQANPPAQNPPEEEANGGGEGTPPSGTSSTPTGQT